MFLKLLFAAVLNIPGVLFLLYATFDPFLARQVPSRPATVTYLKASHSIKHNTTCHVGYSYVLAGKRLIADESVNGELYRSLHVGQTIQVCAIRIGALHYVEMQNGNSSSDLVSLGMLGLAWNGVLLLFVFVWIILPRHLIRRGEPVWGQITGKRVENRNSASYRIQYKFQTPDGETRDSLMYVARRFYDQAVVGAEVVVLYDLKRDGSFQSLIYGFCDYIAG
jgi:hypothetical protein